MGLWSRRKHPYGQSQLKGLFAKVMMKAVIHFGFSLDRTGQLHVGIQVDYCVLGPFQSSSRLGSLHFAVQHSGVFFGFFFGVLPKRYQRAVLWDEITPFVTEGSSAAKFSSVNIPGSGSKEHIAQYCAYHLLLLFLLFVFL